MSEVSLKEWTTDRLNEIREATKIALTSLDRRLDGMNEFCDTLKDQASRFITRTDLVFLEREIHTLKEEQARIEGRASITGALWGAASAIAVSVIGAILMRLLS